MGRAGVSPALQDKIELGADKLRKAGIEAPLRQARWLMESALSKTSADQAYHLFDDYIIRRVSREPLQHIIGDVEFYGLDIKCDARALIPRPDSETIVDTALELLPKDFSGTIADLGTGTGCLLLAILSQRPKAKGFGVEASAQAASLANENVQKLGLSGRVEIIQSTWEDWQAWQSCDLIVSNPPYIKSDIIEGLEPEVRDFDPLAALDGGEDGLEAYRSIFECGKRMKPGAYLLLEIGYDQANSVTKLAKGHKFEFLSLHQDLGGNSRAITFKRYL